jgi:hypothetical protein
LLYSKDYFFILYFFETYHHVKKGNTRGNKNKRTELIGDGLASNSSPANAGKGLRTSAGKARGERGGISALTQGVLDGRKQTATAWGLAGDFSISARSESSSTRRS